VFNNEMMRRWAVGLLAAAGCVGAGCGGRGLADSRYPGETIATFSGELVDEGNTPPSGPVSMAILWVPGLLEVAEQAGVPILVQGSGPNPAIGSNPGGCNAPENRSTSHIEFPRWISESVEYQPEFPIQFQVPIHAAPPPEAQIDLAPLGGQGHVSLGLLIAYSDDMATGSFEPSTPGHPGDRLLATSIHDRPTVVVFLDGTLPANRDTAFLKALAADTPQGYSLSSVGGSPQHPADAMSMPVSTPIHLSVVPSTPKVGSILGILECGSLDLISDTNPSTMTPGAELSCAPDRRSYVWSATGDAGVCTIAQSTGFGCLAPGQTAPASWPCP
jgi:hypothetical protein